MSNKTDNSNKENTNMVDEYKKIILNNSHYCQRSGNVLPPASVVLPLLTGLAHRSTSETSRALVMEALCEYEATQRICKWLCKQDYILQKIKKNVEYPKMKKPPHIHWLFQSLLSPSIRVRRAAGCILLDGSDGRQTSCLKRTTVSSPRLVLRDALLNLIQIDLDSFYYNPKESLQQNDDHHIFVFNHYSHLNHITRSDGDYMIQLFGMLSHIICDDDHFPTDFNGVTSVVRPDSASPINYENSLQSKPSSKSIEIFLAAGGLRWVTRNILLLATLLLKDSYVFRDKTRGQSRYFTALSQDELYLEAIQTRLLLLSDLSYRLLLFSSISMFENKRMDSTVTDVTKSSKFSKVSEAKIAPQNTEKRKQSESLNSTNAVSSDRTALIGAKTMQEVRKKQRQVTLDLAQALLWNPTRRLAAISFVAQKAPFSVDDNNINNSHYYDQLAQKSHPMESGKKSTKSCQSVLLISQQEKSVAFGSSVHTMSQMSLSPLACLLVAREILKSESIHSTRSSTSQYQPSNFPTSRSIIPGVSSSNKNKIIVASSTSNHIDASDSPFPNRINGMDKCAEILGKLVNPTSQPSVIIRESTNLASKKSKKGMKHSSIKNKNKSTKSSLKRKRDALRSLGKLSRIGGSKRKRLRQKPFSGQQQHISTDSIANFLFGRDAAMRIGNNNRSSASGRNSKSMVVDALTNVLDQHDISSSFGNDQDDEDIGDDTSHHEVNEQELDIELIEGEENSDEGGESYGADDEVRENDNKGKERKDEDKEVDECEDGEDCDQHNGDEEDEEEEEEEGMVCEMEDIETKISPEDDDEIDSDEGDDRFSLERSEKHSSKIMANANNIIVQDVVMADDDDDDNDDDNDDDDEEEDDDDDDEEEEEDDDDDDDDDEGDEGDILGAPVVGQFDDAILVVDEVDDDDDDDHDDDDDAEETNHNNVHNMRSRNLTASRKRGHRSQSTKTRDTISLKASDERKKIYIDACMEILKAQYPVLYHHQFQEKESKVHKNDHHNVLNATKMKNSLPTMSRSQHCTSCTPLNQKVDNSVISPPFLTPSAEQSLIQSMCDIVKPPKKPLNLKIFMRRAPTQEEFFRGSLSRNPVSLASLKANSFNSTNSDGDTEPRVCDLRQHIANDLQMSDSAELLELLVADKILAMDIKLRVVFQVLWKRHLMENATTTSSGSTLLPGVLSGQHIISGGSGLSMVFSTISERGASRRSNLNENTPLSSLPPMIVTYRLAGVDGEATEDKVEVPDLIDPDAPPDTKTSHTEYELRMEQEYSITRVVSEGRGISVLLRSTESHLNDVLRRIRRDDVGRCYMNEGVQVMRKNHVRDTFLKSSACPSLVLLRYCVRLTNNRKKMVRACAPTILLRMLLNVLNCIDDSCPMNTKNMVFSSPWIIATEADENESAILEDSNGGNQHTDRQKPTGSIGNNPTADALQELIETLASDISASARKCRKSAKETDALVSSELFNDSKVQESESPEYEESTLPMLLSSLRRTSLSPPLRKVIAKLLPFLTYGQVEQSRALASHFSRHISQEALSKYTVGKTPTTLPNEDMDHVLVETFIESAINLPPVSVCHTLRMELMHQGFVERIKLFVLLNAPKEPPSWSPALTSKVNSRDNANAKQKKDANVKSWQQYYCRNGLHTAFRILVGLSTYHNATQCFLADVSDQNPHYTLLDTTANNKQSFVMFTHWIESTSDHVGLDINTQGLGLLAETLLDGLMENNNLVKEKINFLRRKTRERKKEIAEERRNKALVGMSSYGSLLKTSSPEMKVSRDSVGDDNNTGRALAYDIGSLTSSINESIESPSNKESSEAATNSAIGVVSTIQSKEVSKVKKYPMKISREIKPAWMLEMEAMEDEDGLTCAICQEGRTLQPSELLGLYAYVKKISIPSNRGGGRGSIDGTVMLFSLPETLPASLVDSIGDQKNFQKVKAAAVGIQRSSNTLPVSSAPSSSNSARSSNYIITVTAGNAIHCTCHSKARAADRNHPKAPKSEWEGASLRNSRVTCNVIFPLVSSKSSNVPLMAVEKSMSDYQNVLSNTLGSRPKSMLWTILHDIRLLLLRMCYGESLNSDCGGGSLSSNLLLLFYSFQMADMLSDDAEHDASETVEHARELSTGFLIGLKILQAKDYLKENATAKRLQRSIADAAPMSCICCLLYHNEKNSSIKEKNVMNVCDSKYNRWENHKDYFLSGLLRCAGRRYAQGLYDSGCKQSHNTNINNQISSASFNEWDLSETGNDYFNKAPIKTSEGDQKKISTDDYKKALFPFITLFALINQFSAELSSSMTDKMIEESCGRILDVVESCHRCDDLKSLTYHAKVSFDDQQIKKEFELGFQS